MTKEVGLIFNKALYFGIAFIIYLSGSFYSTATEEWVNEALVFAETLKAAPNTKATRTIEQIETELSVLTPIKRVEAYQQLGFLKLSDFRKPEYQTLKNIYSSELLKHGKAKHRDMQIVLDIKERLIAPENIDDVITSIQFFINNKSLTKEAHVLMHVAHVYSWNYKRNTPQVLNALRRARNAYVMASEYKFGGLALELASAYSSLNIQDYAQSSKTYQSAYKKLKDFDYLYFNINNYLSNLSWMFRQTNEIQHAIEINNWQLTKLSAESDENFAFFVYFACGVYEQINRNFERSLECFLSAEKLIEYAPERWEQWNAGIIIASVMTDRIDLAKKYFDALSSDPRYQKGLSPLSKTRLAKAYLDIESGNSTQAIEDLNSYYINNASRQVASFRRLAMEYNTYIDTEIKALEKNVSLQKRLIQQQSILNGVGIAIIIGLTIFAYLLLKTRRKQRILATHDSLTRLYNRRGFLEVLSKTLDKANKEGTSLALGVLDIDRFKAINEVNGHIVGDRVLKETAARIKETLGADVVAGRMGGDEFAFILPNSKTNDEAIVRATELCSALSHSFKTSNAKLRPSVSVGLSIYPENANTSQQLIDCADFALRLCKDFERGSARMFSPSDQTSLIQQRNLEAALANAKDSEFTLHYQPIVDARTEQLTGFEALARWHSPELGFVSPADFIPIAEQTGHINRISRLLLSKSLAEAVNWPQHLTLSFNLSSQDVNSLENAEQIKQIVSTSPFPNERLIAEMTETAIIQDTNTTRDALRSLTSIGISIALDDFGTGYSSINHLLDFEFERIKLDRVLIDSIESDQNKFEIVRTLVDLCHSLRIDCVIEGIETDIQKDQLHKMEVDKFQGYLFSKPIPTDEVSAFLANQG